MSDLENTLDQIRSIKGWPLMDEKTLMANTAPDKKVNVAEQAIHIVDGPRKESYGNPLEMCNRIAKIWSAILGCEISAEQVSLCMIGMKIARECNKKQRDNLVDICGYSLVYEQVQELINETNHEN